MYQYSWLANCNVLLLSRRGPDELVSLYSPPSPRQPPDRNTYLHEYLRHVQDTAERRNHSLQFLRYPSYVRANVPQVCTAQDRPRPKTPCFFLPLPLQANNGIPQPLHYFLRPKIFLFFFSFSLSLVSLCRPLSEPPAADDDA